MVQEKWPITIKEQIKRFWLQLGACKFKDLKKVQPEAFISYQIGI
jgi:hypothetical protein